jgi:integrase
LARAEIAALQGSLAGTDHDLTEAEGQASTPAVASVPASASTAPTLPPTSLDTLFDKWKAGGTRKAASTLSTWRGHLNALKAAFPDKADDAGSLAPEDIIKWKDDLVAAGLTPKTINDGYLACMRTLFGYGVDNRLIAENPALKIKATGKSGKTRIGYTNAEVSRLLEAAKLETSPARRWLPWLAAQTGSRISEVAQLWGNFVKQEGDVWYLDIQPAPDAGTIKEDVSKRQVPIHPTLIEDGFLEFVKARGDGPLFYRKSSGDPTKKHASKGVSNHIGAWIRGIGFDDKRKAPNHALRHWFKTRVPDFGVADRMVDKLQGHAPRSEADKYYEPTLRQKFAAVSKIVLPPPDEDE